MKKSGAISANSIAAAPRCGGRGGAMKKAVMAAQCGAGESVIKLILSRGVEHGPAPTAWVTAAEATDFARVRAEQGVQAQQQLAQDLREGQVEPVQPQAPGLQREGQFVCCVSHASMHPLPPVKWH